MLVVGNKMLSLPRIVPSCEWHNKKSTAHDTTTDILCCSALALSLLWSGTSLVRDCLIAFKHLPLLRHMSCSISVRFILACLLPAFAAGLTSLLPCNEFGSNVGLLYQS